MPDPSNDRTGPATPLDEPPSQPYLERPERSVTPPPAAPSPFKPLLLLVLAAAAVAGAWTSRQQWMPAVGLQAAAMPPAAPVASMPAGVSPASGPVAAASPPPAAASDNAVANAAPRAPAAAPASAAAARPAQAAHRKPPPHPRKPHRPPTFTLPPPVLPPPNESHVAAPAPGPATADASGALPPVMRPTSPAPGGRGLRAA